MHPSGSRPFAEIIASMHLRARATIALAVLVCGVHVAAADTFYVDGANPAAADGNPGTSALPYRTISAAVLARAGPGNTVQVRPAISREQVQLAGSGAAGNPFVIRAEGPGVTIDGADDLSSPTRWTATAGGVYLAASVTWKPVQVFVNGARYLDSTAFSPTTLPPGGFTWVSGSGLYVNAGGANPGSQQVFVGRRTSAFTLASKSWVTIQGFTITRTEDRSIYLSSASQHCAIVDEIISFSGQRGVSVVNSSYALIQNCRISYCNDHGIYLSYADSSVVRGCESFGHLRPRERAANGIYVAHTVGNLFENNNLHDNQDTGLNLYGGANYNLCIGNISWHNGDHGYDNLGAMGNVYIGDLAYHNYKDGWSIEGGSPGQQIYDCIAVDNGLTTNEFDLWVDASSTSGFVSDYNVFWNSEPGHYPVKYIRTLYSTVAAYVGASGKDAHTLEANPRFANAAAGNFHLLGGSAAIDNGKSDLPGWRLTDTDGMPRLNDPSTPDAGLGPIAFSDRGPFEFVPIDRPPVITAPLTALAVQGQPLTVAVTAVDLDGDPLSSLAADLSALPAGNNAVFIPNATRTAGTLTWTPTLANGAGPYAVTFTAANALAGTAVTLVTVHAADRAPLVSVPANFSATENQPLVVNVTAVDPDSEPITSLSAILSGLPAGNATFTSNASHTAGTLTWTPGFADAPGPYTVMFRAGEHFDRRGECRPAPRRGRARCGCRQSGDADSSDRETDRSRWRTGHIDHGRHVGIACRKRCRIHAQRIPHERHVHVDTCVRRRPGPLSRDVRHRERPVGLDGHVDRGHERGSRADRHGSGQHARGTGSHRHDRRYGGRSEHRSH
jgi:parallel beta-helix repeat protein